jgi:hypothetical protein
VHSVQTLSGVLTGACIALERACEVEGPGDDGANIALHTSDLICCYLLSKRTEGEGKHSDNSSEAAKISDACICQPCMKR